ncbi:MAG TPA: hypothetical protein VEX68_01300 [Bryobacteraceae bacterium]|nr:hypothetical protein [Bryobacteraceae bacterium]
MRLTRNGILDDVHRADMLRDPYAHLALTDKYKDGLSKDTK